MSLQELLQIAPPPENIIHAGTEKQFTLIEEQIGTKLPSDYIKYIKYYGGCMWFRHVIISSPFDCGEGSLWEWHKTNISQLKTLFESPLPLVKYSVYPEKNGILLCGADAFGEHIAWVTEGEPDNWPVIYFDYACFQYDRYEMNITTFLLKLVKNEIQPACFPSDAREFHKNWPIASVTSLE